MGFVRWRWQAVTLRASQQTMENIHRLISSSSSTGSSSSSSEVASITSAVKAVELAGVIPRTYTAWAAAEEFLAADQVSPPHVSGLVEIVLVVFYSQLFALHEFFASGQFIFDKIKYLHTNSDES